MRYAAEDCPVNRMKDRDAGAWDAQTLCGLFQCPGCGLTPDHPLMTGDLCQDFGHASSRNQAAIGMASGLGSVLSKKAAMASAGTL